VGAAQISACRIRRRGSLPRHRCKLKVRDFVVSACPSALLAACDADRQNCLDAVQSCATQTIDQAFRISSRGCAMSFFAPRGKIRPPTIALQRRSHPTPCLGYPQNAQKLDPSPIHSQLRRRAAPATLGVPSDLASTNRRQHPYRTKGRTDPPATLCPLGLWRLHWLDWPVECSLETPL